MAGKVSCARWHRLGQDPAVRYAVIVFLVQRVALSAWAALVLAVVPLQTVLEHGQQFYLGQEPIIGGWRGLLLGAWQRWDTLWYLKIAAQGYSLADTSIFAPPLYPLLMRGLGALLGGEYLLAGLVVSSLAYLLALVYFYKLVAFEHDEALARRSLLYLALFPMSFFFLAAYSESLFLLTTVAAFYHARRGEWGVAGVWGMLAPLARLQGAVVLVSLGYEFIRQHWQGSLRRGWWRRAWPLGLMALGAAAFPLYTWLVLGADGPLAPFNVHTQRFHGRFVVPGASIITAMRVLLSSHFRFIEPFDFFFALLFLGLTVVAFRKLPLAYGLYMALTLGGILSKAGPIQPLLSVSRYVITLFPGFILLGMLGQRSGFWHRIIVYSSMTLQLFMSGEFVIWGWVG